MEFRGGSDLLGHLIHFLHSSALSPRVCVSGLFNVYKCISTTTVSPSQ